MGQYINSTCLLKILPLLNFFPAEKSSFEDEGTPCVSLLLIDLFVLNDCSSNKFLAFIRAENATAVLDFCLLGSDFVPQHCPFSPGFRCLKTRLTQSQIFIPRRLGRCRQHSRGDVFTVALCVLLLGSLLTPRFPSNRAFDKS